MDNDELVAVTGGTGFIGRALSKRLLAEGFRVRVLSRGVPSDPLPGAEYFQVDFADPGSLIRALEGADRVVHMAAALFCRSRKEFECANIVGTANVITAVNSLAARPKRFVYISSLAAAGPSPDPEKPRSGDEPERPVSLYGLTKLGGEKALSALDPAVERVTLRPPIVYGKKDSGLSTIARFVKKGIMVNAGSRNNLFSFVYLDDLVEAVFTALRHPAVTSKAYFICENSVYSWRTFITLLAEGMRVKMPLMIDAPAPVLIAVGWLSEITTRLAGKPPLFNRDKAREGSVGNWTCLSTAWEKDTGWKGWTPLKEGIRLTFGE